MVILRNELKYNHLPAGTRDVLGRPLKCTTWKNLPPLCTLALEISIVHKRVYLVLTHRFPSEAQTSEERANLHGPASVTQHRVQLPLGPARSSDSVRGPCPDLYTSDVPAHHEHYKSRFTKEHVCLGWVPGLGILVSQLTRPSHGKGSTRLAVDP